MKKSYILIAAAVLVLALVITAVTVNQGNYEEMTGAQRWLYSVLNAEEIKDTKYVGTVSTDSWSAGDEYRLEDHALLLKEPGEDFVVMNVTDLHMSEYSYTYVNSVVANRNFYYIKTMARELGADLITISGDIFCEDGESNVYAVHRLTEFFDSLEIPWAPIFDGHDEWGNCDLNYICDVMMESEYCLLQKGDPDLGIGNYIINIGEKRDGEVEIVHSVFMLHSNHGNINDQQIAWYKWAAEGVNGVNGSDVTSSVILHVPFAQYSYALEEAWDEENECWREGYDAFGISGEGFDGERAENGEPLDNGFFAVIKEVGTTTNAICGHCHENSNSIVYEGVRLTYSLRMGLGGYWDDTFETDNCGVTTLTIDGEGNGTIEHHYIYSEYYPDGYRE